MCMHTLYTIDLFAGVELLLAVQNISFKNLAAFKRCEFFTRSRRCSLTYTCT